MIYVLPVLFVVCTLAGIYFLLYARNDQARDFVTSLLDESGDQKERIKQMQQQFILKKRRTQSKSTYFQKLDVKLEKANLYIKPNEFLLMRLLCIIVGAVAGYFMGNGLIMGVVGAIVGNFVPIIYLNIRIWLRMSKAQKQFADVIDTFVNCFKSGYAFSKAVQVVSERYDDPWGTELGKVSAEMNFGSSVEDALYGLARRIENPDTAMFVTAVLIQRETGGNLAQLLSCLSNTVRERYKLLSKVSALSAQGKLSALIIFMIPFGLATIYSAMFPEMMDRFAHNPIGIGCIVIALGSQMIGGLVLNKIVSLEV